MVASEWQAMPAEEIVQACLFPLVVIAIPYQHEEMFHLVKET